MKLFYFVLLKVLNTRILSYKKHLIRNYGLNFGPLETQRVQSYFPYVMRTPKIPRKWQNFGKKYEKIRKIGQKSRNHGHIGEK